MTEHRLKKTLCQNFQATGKCQFGGSCHFAHGEHELGTMQVNPESRYKKTLCTYWESSGKCRFGSQCSFAHGEHELGKPPPTALEGSTDMGGPGKTMSGRCTEWLDEKGFGFIKAEVLLRGGDVFVFRKELEGCQELIKGERVLFEMEYDEKRQKYKATKCWRENVADSRYTPVVETGGGETTQEQMRMAIVAHYGHLYGHVDADQAEMQAAVLAHYGHETTGHLEMDQVMLQHAQLQHLQQARLQELQLQQQQQQQASQSAAADSQLLEHTAQSLRAEAARLEEQAQELKQAQQAGYGAISHSSQSSYSRSSPYGGDSVRVAAADAAAAQLLGLCGGDAGGADAGGGSLRITAANVTGVAPRALPHAAAPPAQAPRPVVVAPPGKSEPIVNPLIWGKDSDPAAIAAAAQLLGLG